MLIAVDTGGTKTLVASFGRDGSLQQTTRFPTPKDTTEYIATLVDAISEVAEDSPVSAISIGVPGVTDGGVAVWCHNLGWHNFDIESALKQKINVPIYLENDANLAGLAETLSIDPVPLCSLYVTISTGIGTGITIDGTIHPALRNSEGGHSLVEFDGLVQDWENFASGAAIYRTYQKYGRDITSVKTWNQIADRISRGFLAHIPMLQPDVIIIGGSMGTHYEKYSDQLGKILEEKLPPDIKRPRIIQALHPEEAVIYGCYYYATSKSA